MRIKNNKTTLKDLFFFIKDSFWLFQSYLISFLTGIILSWIYANSISKNVYGEYTFVLSILASISFFSLPGMGQVLVYSLMENKYGNLFIIIKQTIFFSLIGSLIFIILFFVYLYNNNTSLALSFFLLMIIFPLYSFGNYYQAEYIYKKRMKLLSLINISNSLLTTILLILSILFFPFTPILILANLLPSIVISLIILIKQFPIKNKSTDINKIKTGWHLSATYSLHFLTKSLDKIILGISLPFSQLAIYSIALTIPDQGFAVSKIFSTLATAHISEIKRDNFKQDIYVKYLAFSSLTLLFILIYIFISNWVFKLVYPKYTQALLFSQIYSLSLLSIPTSLLTVVFQKFSKNKFLYLQDLSFLISLVLLMLLLVPKFSIFGAILSQVLARFIYIALTNILFFKLKE